MATGSPPSRSTPGVYIAESAAFGASIVGVATAVPVFIGYTEFAGDPVTKAALYNVPVPISSMNDYVAHFGEAAFLPFQVALATATPDFYAPFSPSGSPPPDDGGDPPSYANQGFTLKPLPGHPRFSLFWQMQMFFANGGGHCYVVSVGSYWANQVPTSAPSDTSAWSPGAITAADLVAGIAAAGLITGPTMTVVPEACVLPPGNGAWTDYGTVIQAMMNQAGTLQDRMAILDLPGCLDAATYAELQACQSNLWEQTGPAIAHARYAAAYGPALNTSIVSEQSVLYTALAAARPEDNALVNNILTAQANQYYGQQPTRLAAVQSAIAAAFPLTAANNSGNTARASDDASAYPKPQLWRSLQQWQTALDQTLKSALPLFEQIEKLILGQMNIMAPSGAIAGVWAQNDDRIGVWNAPANVALVMATSPTVNVNDTQQGTFNVPSNGQSICVIRLFREMGVLVWGARTLDGNSLDNRYIPVRRTLIYIQQSIKQALGAYSFAANDMQTWSAAMAAISSFLTQLWQEGGLVGPTPAEAYAVSCGLGTTMTAQDVLEGNLVVTVQVALVQPAEFIELTFTQTMGS